MARVVKKYKVKKGGSVYAYFPVEADDLLQWLEERSAKEKKPMSHLIIRALMFERVRIAEIDSGPCPVLDDLDFITD